MTVSGQPRRGLLAATATLVAVYVVSVAAVHLRLEGGVALWWPAAGLAVALVALGPRRHWPALTAGVALATFAANLTGGRDLPVALMFCLANAAEALLAASVLTARGSRTAVLRTLDDFLHLARAALVGATAFTLVAAPGLALLAGTPWWLTTRTVLPSHLASTLVIVPLALTAGRLVRPRAIEVLGQSLLLVAVTLGVFAPTQELSLAFVPMAVLVWAALRFDARTVAWQLVLVSALCTTFTTLGHGPFALRVGGGTVSASAAGTMVQIWMITAALMLLPLALVLEQRAQLLRDVVEREELFRRNFTDSLNAMLLLEPRGDRLEIVDANDTAVRLLHSGGPVVGRYLDRLLDRPSEVRRAMQDILEGGLDGWRGRRALAADPTTQVEVVVSKLAGGTRPRFAAQMLDVTVEHRARQRIEAAERLTSATLDTTACIILVSDLAGTLVRVNEATRVLTGFDPEELLGEPLWAHIITPERREVVAGYWAEPDGRGVPQTREADVARKDGGRLRVVWNNRIVRDDEDRPAYVVMTGIDVTAERNAAGMVSHLLQAAITTALIGIDADGRITLFNSGAQRMLGYEAAAVVGRPFVELLDPAELAARATGSRRGTFEALTADIGGQGESRPRDWTWIGSDGSRHTISMTLSVTTDATVARRGYLCVGRDVTEQRHSQEMLIAALEKERHAVERLKSLDAAKNEFVSTVSHELRTPVTSIVGYTEMLREGMIADPDRAQPMLETIARNGDRLINLCNDLLLLGGIDSGAAGWGRDPVDLTALLRQTEESMRPFVNGRDLHVSFVLPGEEVRVLGDRAQLERATLNLLSNAVKFTEDGGRVGCRLSRRDGEAWLVVEDTGIGIPREEQAGLFQKFFRSSTAQARAIQGTGLGLSIVNGIVSSHGGRIDVDSAHLAGTTFTVRLPLSTT
ncbi:PAS domain S-box protein [Nocardioides sp. GCM10027113]|uniref:PAS domain S-box protein n=1 Tax=unclassified Nocardioides TaxID=2615069 RepID=UPI003610AB53